MSEKALDTLVDLVNFRIAATGKKPETDKDGNINYVESALFDRKDVERAISLSLAAFNMAVFPTYLKIEDEENMMQLSDLLVTYASYLLLVRQSLLEKGREYTIQDNGVGWTPPLLADFVYNVARELHENWWRAVTELKGSGGFDSDFVQEPDEE